MIKLLDRKSIAAAAVQRDEWSLYGVSLYQTKLQTEKKKSD